MNKEILKVLNKYFDTSFIINNKSPDINIIYIFISFFTNNILNLMLVHSNDRQIQ